MNGMIMLAAALSAGLPKLEFAEWGRVPADVEMTVRKEVGSPFTFIDVAPKAAATNARPRRIDLPALTVRPFATKPKAMSYSDRSKYPQGCGAGDEASTKAFADEVKCLGLDKYGFTSVYDFEAWSSPHVLSVNGKTGLVKDEDLLSVAERFGIGTAKRVLKEVKAAVAAI